MGLLARVEFLMHHNAVDTGKIEIEDDNVRYVLVDLAQGSHAIRRGADLKARHPQDGLEHFPCRDVIVNHQNRTSTVNHPNATLWYFDDIQPSAAVFEGRLGAG